MAVLGNPGLEGGGRAGIAGLGWRNGGAGQPRASEAAAVRCKARLL